MDTNHIDIRIAQENIRHEHEISRLDKAKNKKTKCTKEK